MLSDPLKIAVGARILAFAFGALPVDEDTRVTFQ